MNNDKRGTSEAIKIEKIKELQGSLDKELISMKELLDELTSEAYAVNSRLHQARFYKTVITEATKPAAPEERK